MKRLSFHDQSQGVTLIELLVGVAIVGILMAVAAPSLSALMERRRVVAAAGEIASIFAFARSEANVTSSKLSLHLEEVSDSSLQFSCARVSADDGSLDRCSCNKPLAQRCVGGSARLLREYILPRDTSVTFEASALSWGHNGDHVAGFERGVFLDVQGLQVTVRGTTTGAQLRVEYNNAGRVRTCSPDGVVSGIQPC